MLSVSDQLVPPVNVTNDLEETLLRAARSDDLETLQELLNSRSSEKIQLNINCKGKKKGTRGWTALHLASYFGNKSVIELLLENGADPNVVNDDGDTPLHKAALTSRFEVLEILLRSDANVCAINGEGKSAEDLATNRDAKDLLEQSRKAAEEIREGVFLAACKDGFLSRIEEMLECVPKVNINCVDRLGNTALHSAAYLDNRAVAICLLEHGIDTTIRNHHGHLASDMALNSSMKEMLGVPPIKSLSQTPFRYQGPLFKHQRFRGWKPFWVILDRGVLSYYKTPGNAAANFRRRFHKHLNSAVVLKAPEDLGMFVIRFPDGDQHRLSLTPHCTQRAIERQKWIAVIGEHVTFSSRMLSATVEEDDADDDTESLLSADFATVGRMKKNVSFVYSDPQTSTHVKSLRSMKDALQTAEAYKELLAQDSEMLSNSFNQLPITYRQGALYSLLLKVDTVQRTAKDVVESLNYCLNLFRQQEDLRVLELKRSKEKCRVLEESLLVLAKQHRNLELSLSTGVSHEIGAHPFSAELGGGSEKRIRKKKPNLRKPVVGWIETETCGSDGELVDCTGIDRHLNSSDSEYNTPYGSMSDLRASAPSPMIHVGVTRTRIAVLGAAEDEAVMTMIEERSEYGRLSLPSVMPEKDVFNLWSILKSCIGKDLSKITMPVVWNEPVSILQRLAESMEYAELLKTAAEQDDPVTRMEYVAAFAVSALSGNWDRLMKPFNPLLGETYELERDNYRLLGEQVSHHPPISAMHVDHELYTLTGSTHPKLRFWGKSVEITPKGVFTLFFKKRNEYITWSNPPCCVHNIIVGKLWYEQYGQMEIENHTTKYRCSLTFRSAGWFSKNLHAVEGFVLDERKQRMKFLYGRWVDIFKSIGVQDYEDYAKNNDNKISWFSGFHWPHIFGPNENREEPPSSPMHGGERSKEDESVSPGKRSGRKMLSKLNSLTSSEDREDGSESTVEDKDEIPRFPAELPLDIPGADVLWEVRQKPVNSDKYYNFSAFALALNELQPGMRERLCCTDSRLRPDMRKLEEGKLDEAAAEKHRLEEKQRESRKARKKLKNKVEWKPRWFSQGKNPATGSEDWNYTGDFWNLEKKLAVEAEIF